MRIRSIRPEFWTSEDVAGMDWYTRLVYVGLWSYVDDNGVGRDVEALIVAALFPLDGDIPESSRRVTGALRHLSTHGQITRYRVDGKAYLHVNQWLTHQRIEKKSLGRYPLPTSENAEIQEPSPTTPGVLPEPSTPGEGEKGRRGEGEKSKDLAAEPPSENRPRYSEEFEEFWSYYPRSVGKIAAGKSWARAIKQATKTEIIEGARQYGQDPNLPDDEQFIPHPAKWLNDGRWADGPLPPRYNPAMKPSTTDARVAAAQSLKRPEYGQGSTRNIFAVSDRLELEA
jgi:hypothetical protein